MTNKEAIEILTNRLNTYYCTDEDLQALDLAIKALEERPQDEWLHNSDRPDNLTCSVCNCGWDMWRYESKELKFCPNCGADMRGGAE